MLTQTYVYVSIVSLMVTLMAFLYPLLLTLRVMYVVLMEHGLPYLTVLAKTLSLIGSDLHRIRPMKSATQFF